VTIILLIIAAMTWGAAGDRIMLLMNVRLDGDVKDGDVKLAAGRSPAPRFSRVGGSLCLDFANTVSWRRHDVPIDRIPALADLLSWSTEVGLLPAAAAAGLADRYRLDPAAGEALWSAAVRCREAVYAVFSALAAGSPLPAAETRHLTRTYAAAVGQAVLAPGQAGFDWSWPARVPADRLLLWSIALSAVELLRSADCRRVRECADGHCGWLFLDSSRNASRRWCDSADCGNRARVRRHYARRRASQQKRRRTARRAAQEQLT
jgi:predicted RNA-binding Zn ribbon-like protein